MIQEWTLRAPLLMAGFISGLVVNSAFGNGRYQMQIQSDDHLVRMDTVTGEFQVCERGPRKSIFCWKSKLDTTPQ